MTDAKIWPTATEAAPDVGHGRGASAPRIGRMLNRIASVTSEGGEGITRLAYTHLERAAHRIVAEWALELGLTVTVDAVGNTYAELPGSGARSGVIGIGSHLDSVPRGGRFDGIVGVVGAVEVLRLLRERQPVLLHPVRLVVFAAEEGARFGEPCLGSKAVAGVLDSADLDRLRDRSGTTLRRALEEVDLNPEELGAVRWDPAKWAAFLELHIEQGAVLVNAGIGIGLVDTVSGSTRVMVDLTGRADHSGATPMLGRADALAAAAEALVGIELVAHDPQHHGVRVTAGFLEVEPNSVTTIPGRVRFSIDVRDDDHDRQRATMLEILGAVQAVCDRRGIRVNAEPLSDTVPTVLPVWLRELAIDACQALGFDYRVMMSGASHDAQVVSRLMPAGMIFVPSRDGVSHAPAEWTSSSDVARGVEAMYGTLLRIDETVP